MSRREIFFAMCLFGVLAVPFFASAQVEMIEKGIFSVLKIGQTLTAREQGGGWSLVHSDGDALELYRVIEITQTFIRLEDSTELRELTIPIYSIKSIERLKPANE